MIAAQKCSQLSNPNHFPLFTMAAVSIAIIGKSNEPIYLREFSSDEIFVDDCFHEEELFGLPLQPEEETSSSTQRTSLHCSLRQQFLLHAALDRFEQLAGPPPGYAWRKQGTSGADGMFVGLLQPNEDLRVYGTLNSARCTPLLSDGINLANIEIHFGYRRLHDHDPSQVHASRTRSFAI
jgi:hypothetical protein